MDAICTNYQSGSIPDTYDKMSIIERNLRIQGKHSPQKIVAFFDSGSSYTIINKKFLNNIIPYDKRQINQKVELGNGTYMYFNEEVLFDILLNKNAYSFWIKVSNEIKEQLIIGVDFMQRFGHTLEFKKDTVRSKPMNLKNMRGVYVL